MMKWYDYRSLISAFSKFYGTENTAYAVLKSPEWNAWMKDLVVKGKDVDDAFLSCLMEINLASEGEWIGNGRPYYDLYPTMVEAFTKVDLRKIKASDLKPPFRSMLIRFSHGNCAGLATVLMTCVQAKDKTVLSAAFDTEKTISMCHECGPDKEPSIIPKRGVGGCTIPIGEFIVGYNQAVSTATSEMMNTIVKIFTTICLIRNNPDLIEQQPLASDLSRFERSTDFEERQKLLDRAKRRGKLAFAIGKHIETAAGFRHPHFAIRWMGHGEPKTPVLRPIKGCIVNRQKITNVPTGYLDDLYRLESRVDTP